LFVQVTVHKKATLFVFLCCDAKKATAIPFQMARFSKQVSDWRNQRGERMGASLIETLAP
jgi:hypothetical protein